MPEVGRTHLQMMLVQQAGASALPLSILSAESFLPFIRASEQLCLDEFLAPLIIYWSRHSAHRLLPGGALYRQLLKDASCVSIFSEQRTDPPDEWCVLIESPHLSMIVYGQQAIDASSPEPKYQCSGSLDAQVVRQAFNRLLPIWQFIDLTESNRLEDARVNIGYCESAPTLIKRLRSLWPVVKSPIQENLLLAGGRTNVLLSGEGKIVSMAPGGTSSGQSTQGPSSFSAPTSFATEEKTEKSTFGETPHDLSLPPNAFADAGLDSGEIAALDQIHVEELLASEDYGTQKPTHEPLVTAQAIIADIIGRLRHTGDLNSILQFAIENLTVAARAERGLIWQIVGDQLAVTNEFATSGHTCFVGNRLGPEESTAIVLEFLSRFPDESGAGVISIADTSKDTNLHKMSPMLSSLIELGEVKARLVVQLRSRGIFSGFLELQQCGSVRSWKKEDAAMLQSVAEMLSVVVQQSFDQSRIEMDAREMKLINEIASLFRESRGTSSQASLVKSVMLVAEHMGFVHSQIYLYNQEEDLLIPQIQDESSHKVQLLMKDNPFVTAFASGRGKVINMEYSRKGDPFFGHDTALILPLVSEGERLGVVGLWQRQATKPAFRAQDRELGLTIAGHLSNVIRAEQAILQIRADQARAALINKVSSDIRQPLKEVDHIMETLVHSLRDHFELSLCVVSLYDAFMQELDRSKFAIGKNMALSYATESEDLPEGKPVNNKEPTQVAGEKLLLSAIDELEQGKTIFLSPDQIRERLPDCQPELIAEFGSATLVPLVHAGNFKAALCIVRSHNERPLPKNDMMMIADLADRVAVVISHAQLFVQVERQAVTDPMTGLFNRRYFQEQLVKEVERYQRFGHPFSLVMVDLDYLKKINDSLGHHFGDIAIKHIANVLKRNVRDVDTVGRYGGEEFVILLPETDVAHARMVSERICLAIREEPLEEIGTVTASLGLATCPTDSNDRDKLFELADQALFLAKRTGRNQVCSVSEDLMPSLNKNGAKPTKVAAATPPLPQTERSNEIDPKLVAEGGLLGILSQLSKAIEVREADDPVRSKRIAQYAGKIASALHLTHDHAEVVVFSALYSNLGKLDIPETLLRKTEPLSSEEAERLKACPATAAKILAPAKLLQRIAPIIEAHQEHWDGTGYPKGLAADQIPMEARIVAVVDAFVSMTSQRPLRKNLKPQEAMEAIQNQAGKQFDPRIVKIFLSMLQKDISETESSN